MFDLGLTGLVIMSPHMNWEPQVGSIGIEDGRIRYVGPRSLSAGDCRELRQLGGHVALPGFVNGHCHGDMTLLRGMGDGMTLAEQNAAFTSHNWFEAYLSEDDRFLSRRLTYAEALLGGCTFILENMYWSLGDRAIDAVLASGIRAGLAEDYRPDFRKADRSHESAHLRRFATACREAGILPVLGSVSEEDFSHETLATVRMLAEEADMLITCHLAETSWRMELIRDRYGMSPVELLAQADFLGPDLVASHVVYTSETDRLLLLESETKVINTPLCEYKIADGLAAIPEMLDLGITVGLGTDGALWNNSIDLFREMKGIVLANSLRKGPRSLSPKAALTMATLGGAKAFGQDDMGSLAEGMRADLMVVNLNRAKFVPQRLGRYENISSSLVFNATAEDIHSVYIGGEERVRDGNLLGIDQEALFGEANHRSERLFSLINE